MSGRLKQVIAALELALAKLLREGVAPLSPRAREAGGDGAAGAPPPLPGAAPPPPPPPPRLVVRLLAPQAMCGIIIGRAGATVRAAAGGTGTQIRVAAPEGHAPPLTHRVVAVSGALPAVLRALALLTLKQAEDPKYLLFAELPATYAAGPAPGAAGAGGGGFARGVPAGGYLPLGGGGGGGAPWGGYGAPPGAGGEFAPTALAVVVTEEQLALLAGADGRGLDALAAAAGVRLLVEPAEPSPGGEGGGGGRGGAAAAPPPRRLTLAGAPEAIHYAHFAIGQRLASAVGAPPLAAGGGGCGPGPYASAPLYLAQPYINGGTTFFSLPGSIAYGGGGGSGAATAAPAGPEGGRGEGGRRSPRASPRAARRGDSGGGAL